MVSESIGLHVTVGSIIAPKVRNLFSFLQRSNGVFPVIVSIPLISALNDTAARETDESRIDVRNLLHQVSSQTSAVSIIGVPVSKRILRADGDHVHTEFSCSCSLYFEYQLTFFCCFSGKFSCYLCPLACLSGLNCDFICQRLACGVLELHLHYSGVGWIRLCKYREVHIHPFFYRHRRCSQRVNRSIAIVCKCQISCENRIVRVIPVQRILRGNCKLIFCVAVPHILVIIDSAAPVIAVILKGVILNHFRIQAAVCGIINIFKE